MKIGRNDPCSCGSGKKFKKCCMLSPIGEVGVEPKLPPFITCNHCEGEIPAGRFDVADTSKVIGLDFFILANCEICNKESMAVSGDPELVEAAIQHFNDFRGGTAAVEGFKLP